MQAKAHIDAILKGSTRTVYDALQDECKVYKYPFSQLSQEAKYRGIPVSSLSREEILELYGSTPSTKSSARVFFPEDSPGIVIKIGSAKKSNDFVEFARKETYVPEVYVLERARDALSKAGYSPDEVPKGLFGGVSSDYANITIMERVHGESIFNSKLSAEITKRTPAEFFTHFIDSIKFISTRFPVLENAGFIPAWDFKPGELIMDPETNNIKLIDMDVMLEEHILFGLFSKDKYLNYCIGNYASLFEIFSRRLEQDCIRDGGSVINDKSDFLTNYAEMARLSGLSEFNIKLLFKMLNDFRERKRNNYINPFSDIEDPQTLHQLIRTHLQLVD